MHVPVHAPQADDRVDHHREEGNEEGQEQAGEDPRAEPEHEDRGQRLLREDLKDDDQRIECIAHDLGFDDDPAAEDPDDHREQEAQDGLRERRENVLPQEVGFFQKPTGDRSRRGKERGTHRKEPAPQLPGEEDDEAEDDGGAVPLPDNLRPHGSLGRHRRGLFACQSAFPHFTTIRSTASTTPSRRSPMTPTRQTAAIVTEVSSRTAEVRMILPIPCSEATNSPTTMPMMEEATAILRPARRARRLRGRRIFQKIYDSLADKERA